MKKKILIALLIIVILLLAAAGAALLYVNSYVDSHKDEIQQQISDALGAPVAFSDVSVEVIPALELSVDEFVIKDAQGGASGLSVKALRAKAELIPLLSKQIIVKSIRLVEPSIILVNNGQGLAIKGLPQSTPTPVAAKGTPTPAPTPTAAAAPTKAFSLSVDRIEVEGGSVVIPSKHDRNGVTISAIALDAGVVFSDSIVKVPTLQITARLNGSHPLTLAATDFEFAQQEKTLKAPNLTLTVESGTIQGSAALDLRSGGGHANAKSDSLNLAILAANLHNVLPVLAPLKPVGKTSAAVTATMTGNQAPVIDVSVSPKSVGLTLSGGQQVTNLSGIIKAAGPTDNLKVSTQGLSLNYQSAPLKVDAAVGVTPKGVDISTLTVTGFGGKLNLPTKISQGSPGTLTSQPTASSVQLEQLLSAVKPSLAQSLSGTVNTFSASVNSQTGDQMASSMRVGGNIFASNAVLRGNNLPMQVLKKLTEIPIFSGLLTGGLPDKYKQHVSANDTAIRELKGNFSYAGGQTTLSGVKAVSDLCSITADGTISANGDLDISSTFTFSPDVSMGLVKSFKGLNRALNNAQQLVVPVMIQGRSPMIVVLPDVTKLLTGTITNLPGEALGIVGGLLGMGPSDPDGGKKDPKSAKNPFGF